MWQLLSLAALLLLVLASPQPEDRPKAVVSLQWDRVLRNDNVTLKCQGAYPHGDNSTQWFHNGSSLSNQTSSYVIASAEVKDSGEYRCQTGLSTLSDPVQLKVHPAWLLLQAPRWVFQEGEPIQLRCHSWKNVSVQKVQYFQDGRGKQYSYQNKEFHIPKAMRRHGGSYFCRGIIGTLNVSSEAANITVLGPAVPSISPLFPLWPQITFCLVMGLLFAVDTGLYFSVQRDLQQSLRNKRYGKVTWSKSPEDPYKQ